MYMYMHVHVHFCMYIYMHTNTHVCKFIFRTIMISDVFVACSVVQKSQSTDISRTVPYNQCLSTYIGVAGHDTLHPIHTHNTQHTHARVHARTRTHTHTHTHT